MTRKAASKVDSETAGHAGVQVLSAQMMRTLLVLAAAAFGLYLCYRLALPFLPPLTWAVVLAVGFVPVHRKIERRFANRSIAAAISVAAAVVVVAVPVLMVAHHLIREAANGAAYVEQILRGSDWRPYVSGYPRITELFEWLENQFDPAGLIGTVARWLTSQSRSLLEGSLTQAINVVMAFYLLFYFLRDRQRFISSAFGLAPLEQVEAEYVADRFVETVQAIIFGTLVIAMVQGTLGGLMFWWLGLPTPVFWGAVMGLLAIVPVLGAFVVWVPAAVMLAAGGEYLSATILTIWGAVIVASVDNLLFPVLVGNRLKLHTVVAFIGIVGGIIFLGASGLVLGPAIVAVTIALIEILRARFEGGALPGARSASPPS
jgi:predicted PurR-regulated permease PerM